MADEEGLASYKAQLTQVEAALTLDPGNEDLLKLKEDLLEVIQLTVDLSGTTTTSSRNVPENAASAAQPGTRQWQSGDKCLARKTDDGIYYEAIVEDVLPESETVAVRFEDLGKSDVCQISSLKPLLSDSSKAAAGTSKIQSKANLKKEKLKQQREYRKKRNLKKKMRAKEKEAESEISKNKWMDFNKKISSKNAKGLIKKSIFASPEGTGKVGVGTCGVADKKMTKFEHGAKYNARHLIPR
ncbi:unnamed protein product [Clavelina lepadiformis]|uniref:Tudor domain-containing protein n=1 Tax=Clavelina lepadiformis TaxID=159417 RepID=A0ABP0FPG4_CLALP